jgi:predicted secreted hydrolase
LLGACGADSIDPAEGIAVDSALGAGDVEGYARANVVREFVFPDDHGPHPNFRNEWWYLTGNLTTAEGRRFGYQLTLFRIALAPQEPVDDSNWRSRQMYMGHFAVTDVENDQHRAWERFSRAALGLSGNTARPFQIWLEDWRMEGTESDLFPLRVTAAEDDQKIDLTLTALTGPILQGDRGLSQKSEERGNASYYYSYTRLDTRGGVTIAGEHYWVEGLSWLDREWSTSALGREQSGWDWFALQFEDGRDLMFYRLRDLEGGMDPHSEGVLVDTNGRYQRIDHKQVVLSALEHWKSPTTGDRYPIAWRLEIPAEGIDLQVRAVIPAQEMNLTVRYWEGAVQVQGSERGHGYLEMTQY